MIIKERVWETCPTCGYKHLTSDDEYGCDECGKPIDFQTSLLDMSVYHSGGAIESYNFCSWVCFFKKLAEVETDDFIGLPSLRFDEDALGLRVSDFWDAIKEIGASL
jgi:DNA-directed RNA polymerase subunit RPC12/RpoP